MIKIKNKNNATFAELTDDGQVVFFSEEVNVQAEVKKETKEDVKELEDLTDKE